MCNFLWNDGWLAGSGSMAVQTLSCTKISRRCIANLPKVLRFSCLKLLALINQGFSVKGESAGTHKLSLLTMLSYSPVHQEAPRYPWYP